MPWTLTYCVWYSLLLVAQNYVWCAEKAKLGVLPVVGGLAMNIGDQFGSDAGVGTVGCGCFNDHRDGLCTGDDVLD